MDFPIPEKVLALARAIRQEGGRALLVGGCVRDLLMTGEPRQQRNGRLELELKHARCSVYFN